VPRVKNKKEIYKIKKKNQKLTCDIDFNTV